MCILLTKDGRWKDPEYAVTTGIIDEASCMAWHIAEDNLYLADDGNWYQIVTEWSEIPICPRNPHYLRDGKEDEKEIGLASDEMFKTSKDDKIAEQFDKAKQSDSWHQAKWVVSIICTTMVVFGAMTFFRGCG